MAKRGLTASGKLKPGFKFGKNGPVKAKAKTGRHPVKPRRSRTVKATIGIPASAFRK